MITTTTGETKTICATFRETRSVLTEESDPQSENSTGRLGGPRVYDGGQDSNQLTVSHSMRHLQTPLSSSISRITTNSEVPNTLRPDYNEDVRNQDL